VTNVYIHGAIFQPLLLRRLILWNFNMLDEKGMNEFM